MAKRNKKLGLMDRLNAGMYCTVPKYPLTIETIHTAVNKPSTVDFLKNKLKRCRVVYKALQSTLKQVSNNPTCNKELKLALELKCRVYKYKIRGLQSKIDKHKKRLQVEYKKV